MRLIPAALALVLAATLVAVPAAAPAARAAAGDPKVAIIVGPTHGKTATWRTYADAIAAEALQYTSNVVRVYSPAATWAAVKAAVNGASIVAYLGHGNGWPSPYTYDPLYATKDGMGLNADVNGDGQLGDDELKYYGEPSVATLTPAPNAVMLLFHLCYASGNSEPGHAEPTLDVARQRVDNYGAGFLRGGFRAVIASGHDHGGWIRGLFTTAQTVEQLWASHRSANGNTMVFPSVRTPGATYRMDPDLPTSSFYRSLVAFPDLSTVAVTGGGYVPTDTDPAALAIPGAAEAGADGAPAFADAAGALAAAAGDPAAPAPAATLAAGTRLRVLEAAAAPDGTRAVRVAPLAGGAGGWVVATALVPRDSSAPRAWTADTGTGAFSPNGDGSRDAWSLDVRLSEAASWSVRVRDARGTELAAASGSGSQATLAWTGLVRGTPVPDGTYAWTLRAEDGWGNAPLELSGPVVVDTVAPVATLPAAPATVPQFSPNGDGLADVHRLAAGLSEPGTAELAVRAADGTLVASRTVDAPGATATVAWDGLAADGGRAPDGTYRLELLPRDRAGNPGLPVAADVELYAALAGVAANRTLFFPQDGDRLAPTATFSFRLLSPATVDWTIVDGAGAVVRTVKRGEALAAGPQAFAWNGRNDAGAFVARGTYRAVVTATDGTRTATGTVAVLADAFRIGTSTSSPARGQRLTITVTSAEALSTNPRVTIYQPGIAAWSAATYRVSTGVYRVTVTLRSSSTGTMRIKASAYDTAGALQATNRSLPLR